MIKHFCDRCKRELEPEDFNIFIRADVEFKILVSAVPCGPDQKPLNDICRACILDIITTGQPCATFALPTKHLEHPVHLVEAIPTGATGVNPLSAPIPAEVATSQPPVYVPSKPQSHEVQPAVLPEEKAAQAFDAVPPAPFDRVTNPPPSPRAG